MNGRIYDPTLGRFLQADPHIQAPMNSQSYNRYSYVLNNPLSYTDPSGYFFKSLVKSVKKHWKTIVQIGITMMTAGAGLGWAIAGGALSRTRRSVHHTGLHAHSEDRTESRIQPVSPVCYLRRLGVYLVAL